MTRQGPTILLAGFALAWSSGPESTPKPSAGPSKPDAPAGKARAVAPPARDLRTATGDELAAMARGLEQILAARPTDRQALFLLAEVARLQADRLDRPESSPLRLKAAGAMRRLAAAYKDLSPVESQQLASALYGEAGTLAAEGKAVEALGALADAVDAGLDRVELLEGNRDFDSLRASPKFQALEKDVVRKARARALERARGWLASSKPFRFDFELPDLGGETVSRADFEGKVLLVNVWGTWCPPCRRLVPRLVRLLEREGKRGLEVVGINYERAPAQGAKATVEAFVTKNHVPYPCLLGDEKTRQRIPRFAGFPTTLFVDRAGMARLIAQGEQPWPELEAIVTLLLDEAAPRRLPSAGRPSDAKTPPPRPRDARTP